MRRGFAAITVLWLLAVGSAMTAAIAIVGRVSVETSRNRVNLDRARWLALGCARVVQAATDEALVRAESPAEEATLWRRLPALVNPPMSDTSCTYTLEAAGTRLDLNSATTEMVERLVEGAAVPNVEAAVRSFEVWRSDSTFDDVRQFTALEGVTAALGLDTLVSVESGRVSLATAPAGVLVSVPGVTTEIADTISNRARSGAPVADLSDVLALVSETSRDELMARFPDAAQVSTAVPDAWILRVSARCGQPVVVVTLEWRLMRAARRVVVTQARTLQ